ncbi:MAG: hypothetical protein ACLFSG_05130, partial [Halothiobacillaceae bacterium]
MNIKTRRLFWPLQLIKMVARGNSYLYRTGWVESVQRGYPCRANGEIIPWMNYPVIDLLEQRLTSDLSLFEFGSGFSTRFYAQRVGHVHSVEYDRGWFEQVRLDAPDNVKLLFRERDEDGRYCRTITESGDRYDVVIV